MNQDQNATAQEQSSEPEDLRSQITKAFDEIQARESEAQPKEVAPELERKLSEPVHQADTHLDGQQSEQTDKVAAEPKKHAVPQSWKKEAHAHWDKIPDEVKEYISQREAQIHKGLTSMDEERSFGKAMKETITPYLAMIQSEGGNPLTAVQSLLATAYTLRTADPAKKHQLFSALAQQYGVNVAALNQPQPRIDPTIAALQQQIGALQSTMVQKEQQAQQHMQAQLQGQISNFAQAKPDFEILRPTMAAMLRSGQAKDLDSAYDMARRIHPDTAQSWIAEQTAKSQKTAQSEKAKSAGVSVRGSAASTPPQDGPAPSLREELERQFRAATNRRI